jgi:hypothetical protein
MNGIGIDISKDQEEANALTFEGEKEGLVYYTAESKS